MKIFQHLKAGHDTNGNPLRVYVVYDLEENGNIVEVIDEGFAGKPSSLHDMIELAEFNISKDEYRDLVKWAKGAP